MINFLVDKGLPEFWGFFFLVLWIFVGISTNWIIFRSKRQYPVLGAAIGVIIGALIGVEFLLIFAYWPLDIFGGLRVIGLLAGIILAGAASILTLIGFWSLIPMGARQTVADRLDQAAGDPNLPTNYSTRVDKVNPRWQAMQAIRVVFIVGLAFLMLIPVAWMGMTAFKSRADAVASPPKAIFDPTMEGFVNLLTKRRQLQDSELATFEKTHDLNWADRVALKRGQAIIGQSDYLKQLRNSLIIASISTIASVVLGVLAAYAFSRFKIPGEGDLLFFILSTRMLPPVVVTIPIFLMYREVGLSDTHAGLIILYTVFNLSFSVWLLKGFIDEIPREYEEAALVDGYTRLQAFRKIVIPQALTGIAATTVFCFIFAWNEYAFALMLTADRARTAPPSIPSMLGTGGIEWASIAAGSLAFLIPVVIVTFALRKYLLRGVTFGAIRKG